MKTIRSELHALFPHYLIFMSMAIKDGGGSQDAKGRYYYFTTLTALDSHYFTSATHLSLHLGSSKGPKENGFRQPPTAGRSISITAKAKNSDKLHIINLYQFTANEGGQQELVWKLIRAWIRRHPGERVILTEDLNGSIPGGRHNYSPSHRPKLNSIKQRITVLTIASLILDCPRKNLQDSHNLPGGH